MEVKVTKLTDESLMQKACAFTINAKESKMSLRSIYKCEHSPIRTQLFWIEMYDIPTFVSVHLVRHSIGLTHFVKSNREDRPGYTGDLGRLQPVNHAILANAEAILNIAHKRYCTTTHEETRKVVKLWEDSIRLIDPDLANQMMPWCEYRNGLCPELKPCGRFVVGKK